LLISLGLKDYDAAASVISESRTSADIARRW
jgi:hypothetical protein